MHRHSVWRFTSKSKMPLHKITCRNRKENPIKYVIWLMCIFMLCVVLGVQDLHVTRNISQDNRLQTRVIRTRIQRHLVTSNQSNLVTSYQRNMLTRNQSYNATTSFENPSNYLQSDRFDLIVKMVYAYFYVYKNEIPNVVQDAYAEHIRVWNDFKEYCKSIQKIWFDRKLPCKGKQNKSDFVLSFHKTIDLLREKGFNSSISRIPLDKSGFLLNGAHRVAAAVILSRNAGFEHHTYKQRYHWGYEFFKDKGMSEKALNLIMLEWMKIQLKLPFLNTTISIISIFSNNMDKDETMRQMVKKLCSKDSAILYERVIKFTKSGMRRLITHMYGGQSWLETKIKHMLSKSNLTYSAVFLFFYAKSNMNLVQCKNEVRKLYNDTFFKSTAHVPDTLEENLILAEMILNPNSLQFMNFAKNGIDCKFIAREVASRSSIAPINTLPGIYVGRDDVMTDSGTVLSFFGLRKRTDVDLLFLRDVDKSLLGNLNGIAIQAHAFKNNSISKERAWGEDHFSVNGTKNRWDLFYDPNNFGYCYGIKFVSLKQLVRYKTKRNEPKKDALDVELINSFLNSTGDDTQIS